MTDLPEPDNRVSPDQGDQPTDPTWTPPVPGEVLASDPRLRRLADLRAGNSRSVANLERGGVTPNPTDLLRLRLEMLAAALLEPSQRLDLDVAFEVQLAASLEEGERQLRLAQLRAGGSAVPVPGAMFPTLPHGPLLGGGR